MTDQTEPGQLATMAGLALTTFGGLLPKPIRQLLLTVCTTVDVLVADREEFRQSIAELKAEKAANQREH